jgi:hypothetical protein
MLPATGFLPLQSPAAAQVFAQRGFFETQFTLYPQAAPNDSSYAVAEGFLRYEAFWKPVAGLRVAGGVDARTDSHRQDERLWHLSWWDRETLRPAFEIRRLSATYNHGAVTLEAGKQFIRWGKADILNPTDRFAPRDFLSVVDNDFLGVWAARATIERGASTFDAVYQPRFTPARLPLFHQRWTALPSNLPAGLQFVDAGARYPGRGSVGARFSRLGKGFEYSLSFYDGFNYLPIIQTSTRLPFVSFERQYPQMRMYGGDFAMPLKPFTVKAEAAYFTSSTPAADNYGVYVIQLERQVREWSFVGGYAGEVVTRRRSTLEFAPDRGLARAFLGRATYTIDTNRSVSLEAAARQNAKGFWLNSEYSQAFGQHWRAIAALTVIRGNPGDFLGQYRLNSHALLTLRYSF